MSARIVVRMLVIAAVVGVSVSAGAVTEAGRYKKSGSTCTWDEQDSGPNQCAPLLEGRFKKNGDACTWASNERGADQCRPAKGRFKKSDTACAWDGADSGPDQCNPRQAR